MDRGIMTDEFASMIIDKGYVGKAYQPSNGPEGEMFMSNYCYQCKIEIGCDIIVKSMCFTPGDNEYPAEWIYGNDGQPTCTAFIEKEE